MSLISIITPTFNEVGNIEKLSLRIKEICELNNIKIYNVINATIKVILKK